MPFCKHMIINNLSASIKAPGEVLRRFLIKVLKPLNSSLKRRTNMDFCASPEECSAEYQKRERWTMAKELLFDPWSMNGLLDRRRQIESFGVISLFLWICCILELSGSIISPWDVERKFFLLSSTKGQKKMELPWDLHPYTSHVIISPFPC